MTVRHPTTVPLLSSAFLTGLARWWVFIGRSSRQLATRLRVCRLGAAIVRDRALRDDSVFVATATGYPTMTLDDHRLSAQAAERTADGEGDHAAAVMRRLAMEVERALEEPRR